MGIAPNPVSWHDIGSEIPAHAIRIANGILPLAGTPSLRRVRFSGAAPFHSTVSASLSIYDIEYILGI
jgi:hypothetical protein